MTSQTFAGHFWTSDYYTGLNVLYSKLCQGFHENHEIITLMGHYAQAEETYGLSLEGSHAALKSTKNGFGHDEGASLRKAYEGIVGKVIAKGKSHIQIAKDIQYEAINPFASFAIEHEQRVVQSHKHSTGTIDNFKKLQKELHVAAKNCETKYAAYRRYEEKNPKGLLEPTEDELGTPEPSGEKDIPEAPVLPTRRDTTATVSSDSTKDDDDDAYYTIGESDYSKQQMGQLLTLMLDSIPLSDYKIAILGTYHDTASGDMIVNWIMNNTNAKSIAAAEQFGQDLVFNGFLRLVNNIGNEFANSSRWIYQWRKKAFVLAGKVPASTPGEGNGIGDAFFGMVNSGTGLTEEPLRSKLERERVEADDRYRALVKSLDFNRCSLEETLMSHFKSMERFEYERIQKIKQYLNVFSAALANSVPRMQHAIDEIVLFHETISPLKDLRFTLESYQTGLFRPQTEVYKDPYMRNNLQQVYGVALELRLDEEGRQIPYIVSTILSHLEGRYVVLEDDAQRESVWLRPVPLSDVHQLRYEMNDGARFNRENAAQFPKEILDKYSPFVVANALKLYFLELPDSLVDSRLYEAIKDYYSRRTPESEKTIAEDDQVLVPLINILEKIDERKLRILFALTLHFVRFLKTLHASEGYEHKLANELSRVVLRPRVQSPVTMGDRHVYKLTLDLFQHCPKIFKELSRRQKRDGARPASRATTLPTANREISPARPTTPQPTLNLVLTPSSRKRQSSISISPGHANELAAIGQIEPSGTPSAQPTDNVPVLVEPDSSKSVADANAEAVVPTEGVRHTRGRSLVGGEDDTNGDDVESRFKGIQLIDPPMDDESF